LVGPPELNRSLGGCGVGDAEALLGADALLLRALLVRGGVFLVGGMLAGGVLVDGLLVGGGVGMVLEGGMLADALLEAVALLVADALLLADALPLPTSTGVSSLAGSPYGYTSQATPAVPSEAVPIGPSNPLGSEGSRLSSACASACELKLAQSNLSCASAGLLGLSICWKVTAPTTPAASTNATTAATFNDVGLILINIVRVSVRRRYTRSTVDDSVLDAATL